MEARKREASKWITSRELRDSSVEEDNSSDTRVKPFIITPLGTRVKRILFVGTVNSVSDEESMTKIVLNDFTGSFYLSVFKNTFENDRRVLPEQFSKGDKLLLVGRVNTFKTEDQRIFYNVNPELALKTDDRSMEYWNSRSVYIAQRKVLAIKEALKLEVADISNLTKLGYSDEESESALRAVKFYHDYNYQQFIENLRSSLTTSSRDQEVEEKKTLILDFIKNNDSDGKGCLYENILNSMKDKGIDQPTLDEALNLLGSSGEIYEASVKRFKAL
jgi:RPA family protein